MVFRKEGKNVITPNKRSSKKKKKIVNTGQEDLSANLGCDWCECEQFES